MSYILRLINNILDNYNLVLNDFLGVSINKEFFDTLIRVIFTGILFLILYLLGDKVREFFLKNVIEKNIIFFVNIALGYILLGTMIAMLGFFSLFYTWSLTLFFLGVIFFALHPLRSFRKRTKNILHVFYKYMQRMQDNKILHIAILSFILVGFLRLILPETGVDALWYHTDYPRLYLKLHTMMDVDPLGKNYPIVNPTLAHMIYIIPEFFYMKDASRYIHFGFYLVVILLMIVSLHKTKFPYTHYTPLLILTSPTIIRHAPSAYSEAQWLLCWMLAFFVLVGFEKQIKPIVLSGVLFGGALATKVWMVQFYPVFILYLIITNRKEKIRKIVTVVLLFVFVSILIPLLWYVRAYLITGNPVFPTFTQYPLGAPNQPLLFLSFDMYAIKERVHSFINLSFLSILGLIFLLLNFKYFFSFARKSNAYLFIGLVSLLQIILPMYLGRFLIPFYSMISIILSIGIHAFISIGKYFKFSFYIIVLGLFIYYFMNAILQLPYGLGWAEKEKYLTRILSRDNSSYYDYGYRFDKFIGTEDVVASYGLWGFYYADFSYLYAEDVFNKKERSLHALVESGATKLLIKGGNILWLCVQAELIDCDKNIYELLTYYEFPYLPASQYLYALRTYE